MRAVFVRPRFDQATEYTYLWSSRLISEVSKYLESYVDLESEKAVRENVENVLKSDPNADLVFYGHGDERGLVAQDGRSYVIDDNNLHLLRGRVVYTVACLWGSGGGAKAYAVYKARAVVCYVNVFAFTPYDEHLFYRASSSGYIAYARGERNWAKIKKIMIEEFNKAIEEAQDPWTKVLLFWDREALRVYADEADKPTPRCMFRRIALKLLGQFGWMISRRLALSLILFGVGIGIYVHDRIAEWYTLGQRLHGIDAGFILIVSSFILLSFDYIKWLKR